MHYNAATQPSMPVTADAGGGRALLRYGVAGMMHVFGLSALLRRLNRDGLAVLCYHRILPRDERCDHAFGEMSVSPEVFARHVEFCVRRYECVPLSEACQRIQSPRCSARPLLAFTLDGGYTDSFESARAILNSYNVRGTFFVISSLVGCDLPPWYDRLASALQHLVTGPRPLLGAQPADCWLAARLYNPPAGGVRAMIQDAQQLDPMTRAAVVRRACAAAVHAGWTPNASDRIMTADQLRQLVREGHEVASHSRTHRPLSQLDHEDVVTEVAGSRKELSQAIGCEVNAFAYPGGDNDPQIVDAVRRAGYKWAVTSNYGLNHALSHPLRLNRVVVSVSRLRGPRGRDSMSILRLELSGAGESLGPLHVDPHTGVP